LNPSQPPFRPSICGKKRSRVRPCDIGDEFERVQACRVVVDIGHDHEFVGAGFRDQRLHAGANRVGRADDRASKHAHRLRLFP